MFLTDSEFTEKLITKSLISNKKYCQMVISAMDSRLFESSESSIIVTFVKKYFQEYKEIPSKDVILNSIPSSKIETVKFYLEELDNIDFNITSGFDFIVNETDNWLKETALRNAIIDSADIIQSGNKDEFNKIQQLVKEALCKTIKLDLGIDYFNSLGVRLQKIFDSADIRIPTYFPTLDEYLAGGLPPFTFTVGLGRIHGNKSGTMLNISSRQVLHGHNVVLFTLEMSEYAMAQRLDSIYSGIDINRIYTDKKKELVAELAKYKGMENKGQLFIKQFPTGNASVNDFRTYLHELDIRNIKPDIIYCDYVNLMKPSYRNKSESMYADVKRISEELRALSFEFSCPVFSVSQLSKEGSRIDFEEVDFTYVSESMGLAATADAMFILGVDNSKLIYQNELHYKITKNRIGGRVGEINKFLFDPKSLKLYDPTEEQLWFNDAYKSGCEKREIYLPSK